MIFSNLPKTKLIKNLNQQWFNSLNINQKISLGYAVAFLISVCGTLLGIIFGTYLEQNAIEREERVLLETNALHRLQTAVLQIRTHQQQLIPLTKEPLTFKEEYEHILKHSQTIKKSWSEVKSMAKDKKHHSKQQVLKLDFFVNSYETVPQKYLISLDNLVKNIEPINLELTETVKAKQNKLLEFTNSDLAIKFDGISDDLTEIF